MSEFHYSVDAEGVATILWDVPGARMNIMSTAGLCELEDCIDKAISDPGVKGAVIASGKRDFAAGMDLKVLAAMRQDARGNPAQNIFDRVMGIHFLLRKIELAGAPPGEPEKAKPIATALSGTALGIGYEIALASHRIFCADVAHAKIGLPEIKVGLFPGAGGTTRLSRRLGLATAAPFLFRGKTPDPREAERARLVDEVTSPVDLLDRAKRWVLTAKPYEIAKPWDRRGNKIPGGRPYEKEGFMSFMAASAMLNGETKGALPAAQALLSSVYEGMLVPFDVAVRNEARWFTNVLMNPFTSAMVRTIFISKKQLEKGARRPAGVAETSVRKVGIVGAGMMGSGIGLVSAQAGADVVLLDRTLDAAEAGKAKIESILASQAKRAHLTADKAAETLARIASTDRARQLGDCDLVIEAVFEDPEVKARVISEVDQSVRRDCVIATNTSTLPVSGLAQATSHPDRFIGMHFFSPVHRMLLLEVIRGKQTDDRTVALAVDFAGRIRKTPIVVNDARFFYANRCIIPYINEGVRMVREGVNPALIENTARQLGMPVGPLQLVDETSIDLAASVAKATRKAMGDSYPHDAADDVIFHLFEKGRLGRKSGGGFYDYDKSGRRVGLWRGLVEEFAPTMRSSPTDVRMRLLLVQVLEAVRALEEGVLEDVREGDVGAVMGWGFAPWSGGPFSWLDVVGAEKIIEECCSRFKRTFGSRFAAPELLKAKAADKATFY